VRTSGVVGRVGVNVETLRYRERRAISTGELRRRPELALRRIAELDRASAHTTSLWHYDQTSSNGSAISVKSSHGCLKR
jgi:hypothetical protein